MYSYCTVHHRKDLDKIAAHHFSLRQVEGFIPPNRSFPWPPRRSRTALKQGAVHGAGHSVTVHSGTAPTDIFSGRPYQPLQYKMTLPPRPESSPLHVPSPLPSFRVLRAHDSKASRVRWVFGRRVHFVPTEKYPISMAVELGPMTGDLLSAGKQGLHCRVAGYCNCTYSTVSCTDILYVVP
jgi:hypothetical protein